ncbi:YadA family autotransporter adhesin, partial [Caviibacterium pharyngocola]
SNGIDAGNTKITNVTAGSEDNDAVNFSQLNATNQNVANNTANITKNAAEIAKGIKFGNGTNANQYQLGDTLNVTSGNANIISETIDGGVKLTLADSINLSSVTAGGTVLNSSGLTAGNVKVSSGGIDAGNTKITNVTAGTSDNDAVNLSQLNTSVAAAKTEVKAGTNIAGVTESKGDKGQTVYTVHANASTVTNASSEVKVTPTMKDNNVTEYAVDLSDAAKANITKGVEAKSAVDKGIKFGNGTKANQYQLGDTLNVTSGNANIISETIAGGVKLTLADSINLSSVTAGGTVLNSSGLTAGNVKVSSNGIDAGNNQITNVSTGTADTDAVNVKQLKQQAAAAKTEVKAGTNVASVDAKVGENGQTVYTVNANGTAVKAGDGLSVSSSLDKEKNVTTYTVALNDETKRQLAKEESVVAGSKNVTVTADKKNATGGTEFVVDIAKDLDLSKDGSLTIGNTVVNNDGLKVGDTVVNKDGVKVGDVSITAEGINAGNKTVSNVADGVKDTDAVNVRQLKEIAKTASKGWNLSVNNGKNSGNVAPGDSVDLRSADNNVVVSKEGNNVSFALNNELSIGGKNGKDGSLGVKGADGKDGVVANGDGTLVINGKNGVDGKAGANATLTVAEGQKTLDETGSNSTRIVYTDGKNTTQEVATMKDGLRFAGNQGAILNKKLNETLSIEGGLDNQQAASSKNVRVDSENGKLIVKLAENAQFTRVTTGKTSMSDAGIQAGNVKIDANTGKISGVTAGTADNDAVNVKQLKASKTELVDGSGTKVVANKGNNGQTVYKVNVEGDLTKISSISQGNTKISLKEGEVNMNGSRITSVADGVKPNDAVNVSQLNRGLAQINNNINKVDKDLRGGIAGALASAGLYQATLPGKSMVSAGVGTYKGENAVALGYSRLSDSGKLGVKFSVNSNSRGDRGAAASVGYQW